MTNTTTEQDATGRAIVGGLACLTRLIRQDRSVAILMLAVVLLPVDGTVLGLYQPLWNPISPWLFIIYTAVNYRRLPASARRFATWVWLLAALAVLSLVGWFTVAFHPLAVFQTFSALVGALACICSLDIAFTQRRLPIRPFVSLLIGAYAVAFGVGVLQFVAIHADIRPIIGFFKDLMAREYISGDGLWAGSGQRPQFLFAEPSYIGMHLFGVLLPVYWLTKDKRIPPLICVFVAGSLAMGSGVRIIPDTLVACVIIVIMATNWRARASRIRTIVLFVVLAVVAIAFVVVNPRLHAIASQGLLGGDDSMTTRIMQTLVPLAAALDSPIHLILGFGGGNLYDVYMAGRPIASGWYQSLTNGQTFDFSWLNSFIHTPNEMFTMSAYTSFVAEFGLVGFVLLVATLLRHVTIHHAWTKRNIWWLLLIAYLYVQFEGYAFYALPLFIWAIRQTTYLDSVSSLHLN